MHICSVSCVLPGSCSTVLAVALAACCTSSVLGWVALSPAAACPCSCRWTEPCRTSWSLPRSWWWAARVHSPLGRNPEEWTASEAGPCTCLPEQRTPQVRINVIVPKQTSCSFSYCSVYIQFKMLPTEGLYWSAFTVFSSNSNEPNFAFIHNKICRQQKL